MERTSRYTILLHLARDRSAAAVRAAVITAFADLPVHLRRSLTWDQGNEAEAETCGRRAPVGSLFDNAAPTPSGSIEIIDHLSDIGTAFGQIFPRPTWSSRRI